MLSRLVLSFLLDTPPTETYTLSLHDALPIWATLSERYSAQDAKDYLDMEIGARPAAAGLSGLRTDYGDSLNILLGVTGLVLRSEERRVGKECRAGGRRDQ